MNKEEIIAIYIEVSNKLCNGTEWCWSGVDEPLQLFANLVAEKAIKEALAQEQDNAYIYASNLAKTIWQKHYIKESPKFALLDTTEGVLTQIDNMTCGLVREKPAQPEQEPVGQLLEDAFGRGQVMWFNKPKDESMLYTTPSQIKVGCAECGANGNFALYCVTCAEKFVGGILKDNTSRQ